MTDTAPIAAVGPNSKDTARATPANSVAGAIHDSITIPGCACPLSATMHVAANPAARSAMPATSRRASIS
ncbi:MAG: hypothetical protein BWY92_00363 [Firmicutes bacterium ADurb.BinA052]|nr:MAG: hypothetical protein BWY92_00363 [Firmicutes bacterium ADurb.BinA052]